MWNSTVKFQVKATTMKNRHMQRQKKHREFNWNKDRNKTSKSALNVVISQYSIRVITINNTVDMIQSIIEITQLLKGNMK